MILLVFQGARPALLYQPSVGNKAKISLLFVIYASKSFKKHAENQILTSVWSAQHPNNDQNIKHISLYLASSFNNLKLVLFLQI